MKLSRNIALTLVCILLGVMLSWQFKSIDFNKAQAISQNRRVEDVMKELIKKQDENLKLQARLDELKKNMDLLEQSSTDNSGQLEYYREELKKARIFGGLLPVKGKGLIVTLEQGEEGFLVDESDILTVVNELRAAGAQAISVNDERIVAMSEIREAGGYILVNGVQMSPPYVIKAIASPERLERSLTLIGGVVEGLEKYIKVGVNKADEIIIPAVRDDGSVIRTDQLTPVE